MRRATKSNIPAGPLKWSVERAGVEFGMTSNTLRKALNKNSAKGDADGCFSTKQIADAIFGGLAEEKLATQRQLTRKYELENQIVEASVLDKAALSSGFAALAEALSNVVMTDRNLTRESKENFQRNLSGWPVILETVAKRPTRLRRSKNGQAVEEDASES